jgi:hypothetical protein
VLVVVCDGRWLSDGSGVCREMTRANLGLFTLWGVYEELTRVLGRLTKVTADFKDNQSRVESRYVFWSQGASGLFPKIPVEVCTIAATCHASSK